MHGDVNTLLYLGVLLFAGGFGILVYKNIDSIGHAAITAILATLCTSCFLYCFMKAKGYSNEKTDSPNVLFDYVLLLGCLLLLTLIGYLQFKYNLFGNNWRLASFIPAVLLFAAAYYFDNIGVLSMAVTNLTVWAGLTVAPTQIVRQNNFNDEQLIYTAMVLGSCLIAVSMMSVLKKIKAHFSFTYKNFGTHILFISLLAALFHFDAFYLLWFLILAAAVALFFSNALKEKSFYFLVISVLYGYAGLSYVAVRLLSYKGENEASLYIASLYFIASGIGLIRMFIHYNKILKKDAYL